MAEAERRTAARPLILCYHAIDSSWRSPLSIPKEILVSHLSTLKRRGYAGLTFAESERRRRAGTLPERCAVVTFDDGYASTIRVKPILDELGWPATVFVLTKFVDSGEPMSFRGSDPWTESHPEQMKSLDWTTLEGIAERLGTCETIAYPYGVADDRVAAAARAAGYFAGCTLTPAHRVDEPYRRARVGLAARDEGWRRWAKLSPTIGRLRRTWLAGALEPLHFRGRVPAATPDGSH